MEEGIPSSVFNDGWRFMKTLALLTLEKLGISYTVRTYPVDLEHLDAEHTAKLIGIAPEKLWKTLVVEADGGSFAMAVIPGPSTLDVKALARLSGHKRVQLISWKDLFGVTGYVRGGVSPLASKKAMPVYWQEGILSEPEISVSAGRRGVQMLVSGADLVRATQGIVGPIAKWPDAP